MTDVQPTSATDPDARQVVLVVEDEWLVRMPLVDMLREQGFCVVEAASGVEAIEFIQSGAAVDLIFTDVRMPGDVDGLALLDFARKTIAGVPVIMTSGHLNPDLAMQAGALAFLSKPYRLNDVTALIATSLARAS